MAPLKVGDTFPNEVVFKYIPWDEGSAAITSCGIPINYNTSTAGWAENKVVLFAVPGAFTPTCSAEHVPGFIKKLPELRKKGVNIVAVIAYNDPYVMSAWGKANEVRNNDILFLSDPEANFSKSIGWANEESGRTGRYAVVIDKGTVKYAEIDEKGLDKSAADAVLAALNDEDH